MAFMNEINFNIEDIENINFDLGVAIKKIEPILQDKELTINENGTHIIVADEEYDALNQVSVTVDAIEDLTNELATYNTELTNQETTIENVIQTLRNKGVDGNAKELITSYISLIDNSLGTSVTKIPSGITSIGDYAFYYKNNLGEIELPNSITSIGRNAFYRCFNLVLRKLPDELEEILSSAFQQCYKIEIKKIPVGIEVINSNSFSQCTSLTEMTIEGNINSIDTYAFYGCTNLTKVVLPNVTKVPTGGSAMLDSTPISRGTGYIYVPDDLVDTFKNADKWSNYANQIKGISELEV